MHLATQCDLIWRQALCDRAGMRSSRIRGPCDRQKSRHRGERACDTGRDGGRGHEPRDTRAHLSGKRQEGPSPQASGRSVGGPADTSLSDLWPSEVRGTVPWPQSAVLCPSWGTGTPSPHHGVRSMSSVRKALEHGRAGWLRAPLGVGGRTRRPYPACFVSGPHGAPGGGVTPTPEYADGGFAVTTMGPSC